MSVDPPVGRTWPPHHYEVGAEKIREYALAIGAGSTLHRDHVAARLAGFEAVVAPPTFAAVYVASAVASVMFDPEVGVFDPAVGLGGYRFVQRNQEFEWLEPVCSGDRITTAASLLEAGEREGAQHRIFGSESVRADGAVVCRGRYEGVVPASRPGRRRGAKPGEELEGGGGGGPSFAGSSIAELRVGDRLPPLRATPDRYAPVRYAGASGDFTPFHLDDEFARAIGLPGVILHGLYTYAQLARALVEPFGGDPRALRRLSARFRRPAVPELELLARARVSERDARSVGLACEVEQGGKAVLDLAEATLAA